MIYGLIICAGKQSRFKSETPKALMDIDGKTLLQRNIEAMKPFCDMIYVVCSIENQHFFNVENKIVINSGKGSGDAVWQALEKLDVKKGDSCFVLWGDSLQNSSIYRFLKNNYEGKAIIPCTYEEKPYVQIIQSGEDKITVKFSKFNEPITKGYHDLSVFYCNAFELQEKLREFRNRILDQNGNYQHKHNNEMEFLDVFNETNIKANLKEVKSYKDFSFNTVEQFKQLVEKGDFEK